MLDLVGTVVPSEGRRQGHLCDAIQAELTRLAAGRLEDKVIKQKARNLSKKLHKKFFSRHNKSWTANVDSDEGKAYLQLAAVELPDAEDDPALPVELPAVAVQVPEATEHPVLELHEPGEGPSRQVCARRATVCGLIGSRGPIKEGLILFCLVNTFKVQ